MCFKKIFSIVILVLIYCCATAIAQKKDDASGLQFTFPSDECKDFSPERTLFTLNYNFSDIDTIELKKYVKGSGFAKVVDSCQVYTEWYFRQRLDSLKSILMISLPPFSTNLDFEIIINHQDIYKISDIVVGKIRRRHNRFICDIINEKLNGVEIYSKPIVIKKPE